MTKAWTLRSLLLVATAALLAVLVLRAPTATLVAQASSSEEDGSPDGRPRPVPVEVAETTARTMASVLWVPATVVARHDAKIAAEIPGRLVWVAEVGATVDQGGVLARIDRRIHELRRREAEARIGRLEAQLSYLGTQLERFERLEAEAIAARDQLDETASRKEMAAQELLEARLARDQILAQIDRTEVRAPFPGQVVERLQQLGEYTQIGNPIVRLVDIDHTEVRARAPLDIAPHLRPGASVEVRDDHQATTSRVRAVIPVGDERSRQFEVRIALERPTWVVGAAVRVALPQDAEAQVVTVPRDALVLRRDEVWVFKLRADGTVERVDVATGVGDTTWIEVRGDVAAGDRVVVRGAERLQPGQRVVTASGARSSSP